MDYDFGWINHLMGPFLGLKLILIGMSLPILQRIWVEFMDSRRSRK